LFFPAVFIIIIGSWDGADMNGLIPFILVLVALLALAIGIQMFRTRRSPLGRVLGIFSNIRYAEKLCREFSYNQGVKKFRVSGWEKNKGKVLFLPEGIRSDLANLFSTLADINIKLDTAIKFNSDAYLVTIDVKKLEEPLASCKEQLKAWVQANMHNPEYLPKRVSLFRW
jgi:hypothetical protein